MIFILAVISDSIVTIVRVSLNSWKDGLSEKNVKLMLREEVEVKVHRIKVIRRIIV